MWCMPHPHTDTNLVLEGKNLFQNVFARNEYGWFEQDVRLVNAAMGFAAVGR